MRRLKLSVTSQNILPYIKAQRHADNLSLHIKGTLLFLERADNWIGRMFGVHAEGDTQLLAATVDAGIPAMAGGTGEGDGDVYAWSLAPVGCWWDAIMSCWGHLAVAVCAEAAFVC